VCDNDDDDDVLVAALAVVMMMMMMMMMIMMLTMMMFLWLLLLLLLLSLSSLPFFFLLLLSHPFAVSAVHSEFTVITRGRPDEHVAQVDIILRSMSSILGCARGTGVVDGYPHATQPHRANGANAGVYMCVSVCRRERVCLCACLIF